ncbi:MAG: hypothetical protein ABSB15_17440 [Bryobacteraceae bacterium]|jgi:hypothetical protein
MMKFVSILVAALVVLAGCSSKNVDTLDAVKQGVIRDISKNVNIGAMDVNVVSVSFRDKEADAVVSFAPKGGTPQQGMTMNYTLERQGSEWHIKKRGPSAHTQQQPPPGPMTGGAMGGGSMGGGNSSTLPSGHPPMNGGETSPPSSGGAQLPPGHPPLNGQ